MEGIQLIDNTKPRIPQVKKVGAKSYDIAHSTEWLGKNLRHFAMNLLWECFFRGGGHSAHTHTDSAQEIFRQPKNITSASLPPKNIGSFNTQKPVYIKYPETMQREVRIASSKPRNISITVFGVKNIRNMVLILIGPKKYHFWQYTDLKYRNYLSVCAWLSDP